jgi:hypothetical protein
LGQDCEGGHPPILPYLGEGYNVQVERFLIDVYHRLIKGAGTCTFNQVMGTVSVDELISDLSLATF